MNTSHYYMRELERLRKLATEFSAAHPAIAPLLAGPSSDPDVERLLEGTAYLTGQLAQKLDESYAHIAEQLTALVLPQLLRNIPSCTIIQFTPKASLRNSTIIPKGSRLGSTEINGIPCIFSTTSPVTLVPMRLEQVETETQAGTAHSVHLHFTLTAPNALEGVRHIRLFFMGARQAATHNLYSLLFYTKNLLFTVGDTTLQAPAAALSPTGFTMDEALLPYPAGAWDGYRLLQEYFVCPEKFYFLDIALPKHAAFKSTATNFTCTFKLAPQLPKDFPEFSKKDFALFATPAINIFPYATVPIQADLKSESYPVRANTTQTKAYIPYMITRVTATNDSCMEETYVPLLSASQHTQKTSYTVQYTQGELHIFPVYPSATAMPKAAILSLDVQYSNGDLPARLNIGDVRMPLSTSPSLAEFTNIIRPTKPSQAPEKSDLLWAMLAHLHLNYMPLAKAETLKALLSTYLPHTADALYTTANMRRINAIQSVTTEEADIILKGRPVRGINMTVVLHQDGFSNTGDMALFGMVIAKLLHEYSPINSFMRVTIQDAINQRIFQWLKHQSNPSLQ